MPTDEDKGRIWDILQYIKRVQRATHGVSYVQFLESETLQDSVIHNVQIIGEAASKLSKEFRAEVSSVEWEDAIKMRHIIVHDYGNVRLDIVWEAAMRDLPQLEAALKPWLPEIE